MDAKKIGYWLQHPVQLAGVAQEELESLVRSYPYCYSLKYLLLLKAHLEKTGLEGPILTELGLLSPDTTYLTRRLHADKLRLVAPQKAVEEAIEEAVEELQVAAKQETSAPTTKMEPTVSTVPLMEYLADDDEFGRLEIGGNISLEKPAQDLDEKTQKLISNLGNIANRLLAINEKDTIGEDNYQAPVPAAELKFKPKSRKKESSQLGHSHSDTSLGMSKSLEDEDGTTDKYLPSESFRPKPFKKKEISRYSYRFALEAEDEAASTEAEARLASIIEASLAEDEDLTSETLAKILANQGRYAKAIEMYERLCLIIPKKSTYFASEIERLKKIVS